MKRLVKYKNGNYTVYIDTETGTKIRKNNLDTLEPEYPESMDIKITNQCDIGCKMCHENSTIDGKHGDIMNAKFIETLHPYTELAIGGGNPLAHPDLEKFLQKCKDLQLIPSMTVNQIHFMKNIDRIRYLVNNKLIYGLGVSVTDVNDEFMRAVADFPNAVLHVISGLVDIRDLTKLSYRNFKILILGYKQFRRGKALYEKQSKSVERNIEELREMLLEIKVEKWFSVISFDNLAIKQLLPERLMNDKQWKEFYMGDDGQYTMFIDLVEKTFSTSSTTPIEERHELKDNIKEMFDIIKEEN